MEFDSNEEQYFVWYLDELRYHRIITEWQYHPKPFNLSDKVTHRCMEEMQTKTKEVQRFLMHPHEYQADFLVYWNPEWEGRIFMSLDGLLSLNYPFIANRNNKGRIYSVIDIKGKFAGRNNNSAITFPTNQKWVYQRHKIYVQKIIPTDLFENTFTPLKYCTTNKSGKARKINFYIRQIENYLDSIKNKKIISSLEFKPDYNA